MNVMKRVISQRLVRRLCPFEFYNGGRGLFQSLLMAAPRLAAGVREVDGINSFFPSLLLLIVELRK